MNIRSGKILPAVEADKIAVIHGNTTLSYGGLAEAVWNNVVMLKVTAGRPVFIVADDPITRLTLALSVIEAGGYCSFLHPDADDVLKQEISNWKEAVILSEKCYSGQFASERMIIYDAEGYILPSSLVLAEDEPPYATTGGIVLRNTLPGKAAAFIVDYPVLTEHLQHIIREFGITASQRLLTDTIHQYHDLLEWWLPAISGKATLQFMDKNTPGGSHGEVALKLNVKGVREWLHRPGSYRHIINGDTARLIISCHHRVNRHLVKAWKKQFPHIPVVSHTYQLSGLPVSIASGHMDAVEVTDADITDSLSLHRPFGKTRIAILDEKGKPAPVNVKGSLQVENNCLTNPVLFNQDAPVSQKLFPTGYNARFIPGGKIQLINQQHREVRSGNQVITPDEIEEIVYAHPLVYQAAVMLSFGHTHPGVTVFVAPKENEEITPAGLRQWLSVYVPASRMPRYFVVLPSFPELADGQLDIAALRLPEDHYDSQATANETEARIISIWKETLKQDNIGPADDFFSLGGHSLLAARTTAVMNDAFGLTLSLKDIFIHSTPALLAAFIANLTGTDTGERPVPGERGNHIPLSFSQERVWFIHRLQGSVPFHLPALLKLSGKLDIAALEYALSGIVQRHEVIRTLIREENGEAFQEVIPADTWQMQYTDATALNGESALQELLHQQVMLPFDLRKDMMLRATLIRRSDNEHLLLLVMHHIATDGGSFPVIMNELVAFYVAHTEHREPELAPLPLQYADYAIWQRKLLTDAVLDKEVSFWKQQLEGLSPLELPTDFARPAIQSTAGGMVCFHLDKSLHKQLNMLARQEGVTLYVLLLSAFKIVLARYSGQQDICVGVPVANRTHAELEPLIGFFLNLLALRTQVGASGSGRVHDLLLSVKESLLQAYAHQEVPFEKVVGTQRDLSRSPVFQVSFTLHSGGGAELFRIRDLALSEIDLEERAIQFDLDVAVVETKGALQVNLGYCSDLFTRETILRMAQHYQQVLLSILENPYRKIADIPFMTASEATLLKDFNDKAYPFPQDKTMDELIDEIAARYPHRIAIKHNNNVVDYTQLKQGAEQLANYLVSASKLQHEDIVGVLSDRSPLLPQAIYGIWKAGGAYLPLHPELPEERLKMILEDAGVKVLITEKKYSTVATALQAACPLLEHVVYADSREAYQEGIFLKNNTGKDNSQLAYVIYTSGSTGKPKGAMVEHKGMINHQYARLRELEADDQCRIAQNASQSFDISIFQSFAALLCGGTTVIYSQDTVLRPDEFLKQVTADGITMMEIVPGYLSLVLDELPVQKQSVFTALKYMLVGGETMKKSLAERWFAAFPGIKLVNGYGPTEASDTITQHIMEQVPAGSSIPVGKVLQNLRIYIVDKNGELCPLGVVGEIWVAGVGVGRGYLNDPVKTAASFITDPFTQDGGRLYKTGDLARYLPDGSIEFTGRKDYQVKIRGYRIELGEIEQRLNNLPGVKETVVMDREGADHQPALYAYVTLDAGCRMDEQQLKTLLSAQLPAYMVPAHIMVLEVFPLTANGKVDRKILPMPDAAAIVAKDMVLPRNRVEAGMAAIWQRLLQVETVSVTADFFELGGHSLLAVRVLSAIRSELDLEISIRDFFTYTSIASLSAFIHDREDAPTTSASLGVQERDAFTPLSFSQERLWFVDRFSGSLPYHLPFLLKLTGVINAPALQYALQQIVNRHEVLRSVIREENGRGYQQVLPENGWQLEFLDAAYFTDETELQAFIREEIQTPFNLEADHMMRATLIRRNRKEHLLLIVMHHIGSDGWSIPLMANELAVLYSARVQQHTPVLPELSLQYADYAIWQRKNIKEELLTTQLNYWKGQLYGVEPLQLPTDFIRPAMQSTRGAVKHYHLAKNICEALESFSDKQGVTLFTTMLTVFKVLLHRHSNQHDICVGIPVAGRLRPELESLIGFFVNTMALRSDFTGNPLFTTMLQQVKETTIAAFMHQDVPFEMVVDQLTIQRDMSRNPVFQVAFGLNNVPAAASTLMLDQLEVEEVLLEKEHAKFDISFEWFVTGNGLQLSVEYCTDLFTDDTITRLVHHYMNLLQAIPEQAHLHVLELPMLSAAEIQQQLAEFNDTKVPYLLEQTVTGLLDIQVRSNPAAIAIVSDDRQISYSELDERSGQLANYLLQEGIGKGSLVAVCMARSPELIISITAILKAGAAYVPIDPAYPHQRIAFILSDTRAALLITDDALNITPDEQLPVRILHVSDHWQQRVALLPAAISDVSIVPEDLAYVIYTSGSTGEPKGVMVAHRSLLNLCYWHTDAFNVTAGSRGTMYAGIGFDAAVWEIWPYLLNGGSLYPVAEELKLDMDSLLHVFHHHGITHTFLPTAICEQLADHITAADETLPLILTGGDQLKKASPYLRIINNYGPTESTVVATSIPLNPTAEKGVLTIGRPISNTQIYILNDALQLMPAGASGEIFIGGDSLAIGYLNQDELTATRFIVNPFEQHSRLYRTGDLGRWLPDGTIEFVGRKDNQVKIRGYRVELGEIENVIQQSGQVSQTVVLAREDHAGHKQLVAYIVSPESLNKDSLTDYLKAKLPAYMVPALLVPLDSMPLTPNGKIDRKALPVPDTTALSGSVYTSPRNELEQQLANTWQDLLGIASVGIHDNFFELGGDSIISIQLVSRLKRLGYSLHTKDVFNNQTIARLSALLIERQAVTPAFVAEQGYLTGPSGQLPIQQWYFETQPAVISHFNQSIQLNISKAVTAEVMQEVVVQLVAHHDSLRFSYNHYSDNWIQEYTSATNIQVLVEDLKHVSPQELPALITALEEEHQQSLDITSGQVMRVVLLETPAEVRDNRLLTIIHHLAVDGVSWRILLEDTELLITAAINGNVADLGKKTGSYRQWYQSLEQYAASSRLSLQQPYWEKITQAYRALPVDTSYPDAITVKDVRRIITSLDTTLTHQLLQDVSKVYRTDINDMLLAALARLLADWSGHHNVVIGLEGHGREDVGTDTDISRTVGWFTNLYPVLLDVTRSENEKDLIRNVKEQLRSIPDKGMGYGVLKYIRKTAQLHGNDPWDVVFNYLGQLDNLVSRSQWFNGMDEADTSNANVSPLNSVGEKIAVTAMVEGGALVLVWNYSSLHFEAANIQELANRYLEILTALIQHCIEQSGTVYTPSDYGLSAEVSNEELDLFFMKQETDDEEADMDSILNF